MGKSQKDTKKTENDIKSWIRSPAGKKSISAAVQRANKDINLLKKAREIDPSELEKPMTL
jgi:hypothetical protein